MYSPNLKRKMGREYKKRTRKVKKKKTKQFYHLLFFLCQRPRKAEKKIGSRRRASSVPFRSFSSIIVVLMHRVYFEILNERGTEERHTQLVRSWLCLKLEEFDSDESCRRRISCKSRAIFKTRHWDKLLGSGAAGTRTEFRRRNHIPHSTCFFFCSEKKQKQEKQEKKNWTKARSLIFACIFEHILAPAKSFDLSGYVYKSKGPTVLLFFLSQ